MKINRRKTNKELLSRIAALEEIAECQTGQILNLQSERAQLRAENKRLELEIQRICGAYLEWEDTAKKWRKSSQSLFAENARLKSNLDSCIEALECTNDGFWLSPLGIKLKRI